MQQEKERLVQAWLLYQDGKSERAMEIVKEVLRNNPRSADAWFVLAKVVGDRDKAIYSLRRALSINPQHLKAQQELRRLLAPQEIHSSHKALYTEAESVSSPQRRVVSSRRRNKSHYSDTHSFQPKTPSKLSDRLVLALVIQGIGLTFALLEESGHTYRPGGWYVREEPGHYVVTFYFYLDGKKDKAIWWFVPDSQLVFPKNEWARTFMGE